MSDSNNKLTHTNHRGEATMVDVSSKPTTHRAASATATITMNRLALEAIKGNTLTKGEALGVARIAGILAAKRVPDLIPLCHSLPIGCASIDFDFEESAVRITAYVVTDAKTGVEMEALTACTISALTIYDMAKALDRSMVISEIKLLHKEGGSSGVYRTKE